MDVLDERLDCSSMSSPPRSRIEAENHISNVDESCISYRHVDTVSVDIEQESSHRMEQYQRPQRPVIVRETKPPQTLPKTNQGLKKPKREKFEPDGTQWFEVPSLFPGRPGTILFSLESFEVIKQKWKQAHELLDLQKRFVGRGSGDQQSNEQKLRLPFEDRHVTLQEVETLISQLQTYVHLKLVELSPDQKERSIRLKIPSTAIEFNCVKGAFRRAGFRRIYRGRKWNALWGKRLKFPEFGKLNEYQVRSVYACDVSMTLYLF